MAVPLSVLQKGWSAVRASRTARIAGTGLALGGGAAAVGLGGSYALRQVGQATGQSLADVGGGAGRGLRDALSGPAQGAKEWIVPAVAAVALVLAFSMRRRA